ncbi:MAG TPA: hypothetical protein VJU61_09865, partial [Polyangiaceae bacterium]|nr:hypothetical protein [Polyangiaceae bacterium]
MKLSRLTSSTPLPLGTRTSLGIAGALLGVALGCSERLPDETRLNELSPDERQELCEEMTETLPSADEAFTCSDGSTVRFGETDVACSAAPRDTCAASAGDARACVEALAADPCAAFTSLPAACAPLQAAGCGASYAAPALTEQCP